MTESKTRSTIGAVLAVAVLLITSIALAATPAVLAISSPAGAAANFTFNRSGSPGCTGSLTWDFPDPDTDVTLNNTCSSGNFPGCPFGQNSTSSWSYSMSHALADLGGCTVTLTPTTTSNSTGSYVTATNLLTWNPDFTFVATGGSGCLYGAFTCDSSNVVSPTMEGTLSASGSSFVGLLGVSTSASSAPSLTTSSTCNANTAAALNCALGDLSGSYLYATYSP